MKRFTLGVLSIGVALAPTFTLAAKAPLDPEELNDLYTPQHPVGKRLLDEITTRLENADQPYR